MGAYYICMCIIQNKIRYCFTFQELIRLVIQHKAQLIRKDQYVKDLEDYIDSLLVRVMEATPRILQNGNRYKKTS